MATTTNVSRLPISVIEQSDSIIENGHVLIEIETGKYKIGDGKNPYSKLEYGDPSELSIWTS